MTKYLLSGSVIIFTGINSMLFLRRKLGWLKWLGMITIVAGLVIVGAADFITGETPVGYTSTS